MTSDDKKPIKRYGLVDRTRDGESWTDIEESKHGNFVKVEDYDQLMQDAKDMRSGIFDVLMDLVDHKYFDAEASIERIIAQFDAKYGSKDGK